MLHMLIYLTITYLIFLRPLWRSEMATTAITFHSHTHRRPPIHCYLVTLSRPKPQSIVSTPTQHRCRYLPAIYLRSDKVPRNQVSPMANRIGERGEEAATEAEEEVNSVGVKAALSMLRFYKREISPLLPKSCRYVPSCSEYSMIAYKEYGVVKGTVLTAWRLCRCNPLGGSGFDPPRWFDEERPPEE